MNVITATDLGKLYRRYASPLDSLKEVILRKSYHEPYWALKNISFTQKKGETIGLIGDNGAGKSTLLKMLAGTLKPTVGSLEMSGRVSAILELGSGFHPEFSGIDNAKLGCAMMGLSGEEINEVIPSIIEFSELDEAINRPIKTYSSGMYVRLAFSVVASVDPDILVIDEALAVGDQHFQKKCIDRMMEFKTRGKTLIYCSHALYQVSEICDRAIWLDRGRLQLIGSASEVVNAYQDHVRLQNSCDDARAAESDEIKVNNTGKQNTQAWFEQIEFKNYDKNTNGKPLFITHQPFAIWLQIQAPNIAINDIHVGIVIKRNDQIQCYGVSTVVDGVELQKLNNDFYAIEFYIDSLSLLSGEYLLDIYLIDASGVHVYDKRENSFPFRVRQEIKAVGMCWIDHAWK
jgi:lipopolysaccharide transport system ATP-binding protein